MDGLDSWIQQHGIGEVECLVPDMNGVLRGKVLPAGKFMRATREGALRMPSSVFAVTVTGEYAGDQDADDSDPDLILHPDTATLRIAPGFRTPTAFVFADLMTSAGLHFDASPRHLLKKTLEIYQSRGWTPVAAPELEFYLTAINTDPDLPLVPPVGRSGRTESAPQPYGLESITEYEHFIDAIYESAEIASLHVDTLIHESGTAQLEINFQHGDPLALADEVTVFKRIVRQVAIDHRMYATFMAKPMSEQPGSAMHLHVSVLDGTRTNIFSDKNGDESPLFRYFVGGLQRYLPQVTAMFAPTVNSFRRMRPVHDAPINVQWGYDNRSCGLRVPMSDGQNRRVENRLPGADANPYLALAATLLAGYLGVEERRDPDDAVVGNAYRHARTLPRSLEDALEWLAACTPVRALLGERFVTDFLALKRSELAHFERVVSSWERDHLLLKA